MTITRCAVKSWPVLGFTAVLLGYGAVTLYRWTASALRDGAYDNVAVGVCGLLFLGSALVLTIGAAAPVLPPEVVAGESGRSYTPSRLVRLAGAVAGVSALLWAVAAGLLKAIGRLRISGDSYVVTALPLIGLACAAVLVWILLNLRAFRGRRRFTVTLTPEGITGLNYGSGNAVDWNEIADVAEVNGVVAGLQIGLAHVVVGTADGSVYPVHQSQFCGGPTLTETIRFYWRNPERREDLTTGSSGTGV